LSSVKEPRIEIDGIYHIIFDPELVESPSADLFNVDTLKGQGVLEGTAGGRGASCIIRFTDRTWVLRHYRRGGFVGKVLHDQYVGMSREKSRSWSEWKLLNRLHAEGYPVPRPVAAAFVPACGYYRADLVTEFIPESNTLAEILSEDKLSSDTWLQVGACISRFHQRGVYHADLNAHNILVTGTGAVYLLDFDKGKILAPGEWCDGNLKRLHRSLCKLNGERESFQFSEDDWLCLLDGYKAAEGQSSAMTSS
jgi:3-deoxy-D-manno-octulosonic acid kinase